MTSDLKTGDSGIGHGSLVVGRDDVLDLLAALADKSLVQPEAEAEEPRFRMLETMREYAGQRLVEACEGERTYRAHRDFFLAWAERVAPPPSQPILHSSRQAVTRERDNLRAALEWTRAQSEAEPAVRLALALWPFWLVLQQFEEGSRWIGAALTLPPAQGENEARATLLCAAGVMARSRSDLVSARAFLEESARLWRTLGDACGRAWSLVNLGWVASKSGDPDAGVRFWEESEALFREAGDRFGLADVLFNRGELAAARHDLETADTMLQEALTLFEQLDQLEGVALALNQRGEVARARGDAERAITFYRRSLDLFLRLGNRWGIRNEQHNLGHAFLLCGDLEQAGVCFREALELAVEAMAPTDIGLCLAGVAAVLATRSEPERAVLLFAAATALHKTVAFSPSPVDHAAWERHLATARNLLGAAAFATSWAKGQAMSLNEACACALEDAANPVAC
jgi:tetratricopeptide (TPR) repeat protein